MDIKVGDKVLLDKVFVCKVVAIHTDEDGTFYECQYNGISVTRSVKKERLNKIV